ncbi:meiosis-specific protein MEI4 [Pseudophryne corroboree]|uniref:meiosis-specific protein MEI4 n=1 Tax=Pseudophryne corroboree TaxID=495146 RepID=UPI0030814E61
MDIQKWLNMTSKVALAIAIIRNKPEGKSSRLYTEELAKHISNRDVNWKAKAMELEAEVLYLRQQCFLHKIHKISGLENERIDMIQEPHVPSGDLEMVSQLEDSGCDICNEEGLDRFSESQRSNNSNQSSTTLSYFASPSNHLPIIKKKSFGEEQLSCQIQFLSHLLGLGKLTSAGSHLTDLTKFGNDCSVVAESVSALLNGLLTLYKNPKPSVSRFQSEAIRTVTNLLTNSQLSKYILHECMKSLKDFIIHLIQSILTNSSINRFQMQQCKVDCLNQLGKCHLMQAPLINLIFTEVKHFVDELLCQQNQTIYDISKYENISMLCSLLETIIQRRKDEQDIWHFEIFDDETKMFMQNLDHTILLISDGFPLFSLILWRLRTLFSCRGTEEN